eukprot:30942-Pelagococcus_subviridis.AAC.26
MVVVFGDLDVGHPLRFRGQVHGPLRPVRGASVESPERVFFRRLRGVDPPGGPDARGRRRRQCRPPRGVRRVRTRPAARRRERKPALPAGRPARPLGRLPRQSAA